MKRFLGDPLQIPAADYKMLTDECTALRARVAELEAALTAAWHALESYAHGNGSPELAISIAAHCKAVLGQESGK